MLAASGAGWLRCAVMRTGIKHLHVRWALGASLLLLPVALACWSLGNVLREPAYRHKPRTYWFHQLQLTMVSPGGDAGVADRLQLPGHRYGSFLEKPETVAEAFRVMGTNAIPLLVCKLSQSDSSLHRRIQVWGHRLTHRLPLESLDAERGQATTALLILSPLPPESLRQVVALTTNADSRVAVQARYILRRNIAPGLTPKPAKGVVLVR